MTDLSELQARARKVEECLRSAKASANEALMELGKIERFVPATASEEVLQAVGSIDRARSLVRNHTEG